MQHVPTVSGVRDKAHSQGRVTGVMGVPVQQHNPGDCFMWGKPAASLQLLLGAKSDAVKAPVMVPDTLSLDICEVRSWLLLDWEACSKPGRASLCGSSNCWP